MNRRDATAAWSRPAAASLYVRTSHNEAAATPDAKGPRPFSTAPSRISRNGWRPSTTSPTAGWPSRCSSRFGCGGRSSSRGRPGVGKTALAGRHGRGARDRSHPPAVLRRPRHHPRGVRVGLRAAAARAAHPRGGRDAWIERRHAPRAVQRRLPDQAPAPPGDRPGHGPVRRCCSSTKSIAPTRSSKDICSSCSRSSRSRSPSWAPCAPAEPPLVILTSNRTRDVHDALKRRCLYQWIDYPSFDKELAIIAERAPQASARLAAPGHGRRAGTRAAELYKAPGVSETLDWVAALMALDRETPISTRSSETLGVALKAKRRHRRHPRRAAGGHARARGNAVDRPEQRESPGESHAASRTCSSSAACCAVSASTSTRGACSTSPRLCNTWISASATRCTTRAERCWCIATTTWRSSTAPSMRSGVERRTASRDRADGAPAHDVADAARLRDAADESHSSRQRVAERDDARRAADLERRRRLATQGLRGVHGRGDGRRPRGARAARLEPRRTADAPLDSRVADRASTSGARCARACAPAATSSRCHAANAGVVRARSSCCATSAARWSATRACSCTSRTRSASRHRRVEAFLFSTSLTRITIELRPRGWTRRWRRCHGRCPTGRAARESGEALRALHRRWTRRVLHGGPVVLLISDGWDRGDPIVLRDADGAAAAELPSLDLAQSVDRHGRLRAAHARVCRRRCRSSMISCRRGR